MQLGAARQWEIQGEDMESPGQEVGSKVQTLDRGFRAGPQCQRKAGEGASTEAEKLSGQELSGWR